MLSRPHRTSQVVQRLTLGTVILTAVGTWSCAGQSEHDKIFFSCSAQFPTCPEKQFCNLEDNCCHLVGEAPGTPLGQCKLAPGGTGALPGMPTSLDRDSSEQALGALSSGTRGR